MISEYFVEEWSKHTSWKEFYQIEQDLIINRALIDLFNNKIIQDNLIFRGGTALNKLFLDPPSRYSEDIDLVQKHTKPVGEILDSIREVLEPWLGKAKWKVTYNRATMVFRYQTIDNTPRKLKIEINTTEQFCVHPIQSKKCTHESEWYKGEAMIPIYSLEELMGTKLRALYQRRKGRDLFDMWYVLQNTEANLEEIISIFYQYCKNENTVISQELFLENMEQKRQHPDFRTDMDILLPNNIDWNFDKAYEFVINKVISRI